MRFRYGALPETEGFKPEEDPAWTLLNEPEIGLMFLGSLLLTAPLSLALYLAFPDAPMAPDISGSDYIVQTFLLGIVGLIATAVVHELVHALFHPGAGTREDSVLGVWTETMSFYAFWLGEWSRWRFIACLLAPAVLLTAALLALQTAAPSDAVPVIAAIHLLFCGVDLVGVGLLLTRVPSGAVLRNQGWQTYWRRPAPAAADG